MARRNTLTAGVTALALAATALASAPTAAAQTRPASAANPRLSGALSRLARDPRDVSALLDAGQAALEMNDVDAAIGFYQRADAVIPGNAQVKAGLAGAYVRRIDPFTALPLFDEAARAGVLQPANLGDRGLAYDLVGDTVSAQRYYRQAMSAAGSSGPSDDVARRLALSQAIDGDRTGMEATLSPLLQRQDRAAWRTRAFALAILGKADEAESIARSTMTPDLALAMAAYLRYMPRLTRAQQAAAGNLGFFPRAADIGRDDPRIARYTRNTPELAAANTSLTPAGKPLGRKPKEDKKAQAAKAAAELPALAATPPPEVRPTRETIVPASAALAPAPRTTVVPPPQSPAPRVATVTLPPASQPAYTLPPAPQPGANSSAAAQPAATQPAARKPITLADAFADLAPPSAAAAPAPGAVDVTKVAVPPAVAAKPKADPAATKAKADADKKAKAAVAVPSSAEAAKKTKAEADKKAKLLADKKEKDAEAKKLEDNPARTWVQVAAGRDRKALAFDWRKLAKADPAVFKGKTPYVMTWGQTNRLMTGPFATAKAASAYIAELKKAGVSGAFPLSTDAGEAVDALPGG